MTGGYGTGGWGDAGPPSPDSSPSPPPPPPLPLSRSDSPLPTETSFHPLHCRWTLWFYQGDKTKDWEDCQRPVFTFGSVEEFWKLYSSIALPSELPYNCDYSVFRAGVKPMWEDPKNVNGGRWLIHFHRGNRGENNDTGNGNGNGAAPSLAKVKSAVDNFWLEVLLCLIGESFEGDSTHSDSVNGAVVSLRGRGHRLAVWMSDSDDAIAVATIGIRIKEQLGLLGGGGEGNGSGAPITFHTHEDEKCKQGSVTRHRYRI